MVQVDVFWSYGFGASLAAAAGTALRGPATDREGRADPAVVDREGRLGPAVVDREGRLGPTVVDREGSADPAVVDPFASRHFVATVLFLALGFAPTGLLLLLRHPSWETMQVATRFSALSEWLILGFGITNVTQGVLGFAVGAWLLRRGQPYLAQLNWLVGYFGMFFILLYGWDGLGYDRFLYDRDMLPQSPAWSAGAGTAAGVGVALWRFLHSRVAATLYLDGAYLLPPFFALCAAWTRSEARALGRPLPSRAAVVARYLGLVFGVGLGAAAFSALVVRGVAYALGVGDHVDRARGLIPAASARHVLSYLLGLPLSLALLSRLVLRQGGPLQRWLR